jgi:hypothetical protein
MCDFFVSYAQADRGWAEWIAWQLEHAGYAVVLQAWDFRPSMNFVVEMDKAARNCTRTLAVLSPSYLQSPFCSAEWAASFANDPKGEVGRLVPVRVKAFAPPGLLGQVIFIDLVSKAEAEARDELLRGVNVARAQPPQPPYFPDLLCPKKFPGQSQRAINSEVLDEEPEDTLASPPNEAHRVSRGRSALAALLVGVLVACFYVFVVVISVQDGPIVVRKAAGSSVFDSRLSTISGPPDLDRPEVSVADQRSFNALGFDIDYWRTMRMNRSRAASIAVDRSSVRSLDRVITTNLRSGAFQIDSAGSSELYWRWVLIPRQEGSHYLMLDITGVATISLGVQVEPSQKFLRWQTFLIGAIVLAAGIAAALGIRPITEVLILPT